MNRYIHKIHWVFLLVMPWASVNAEEVASICVPATIQRPLMLNDVVDLALCHNPQTRYQWASVRSQGALVESARAAYYPALSLSGSATQNGQSGVVSNNQKVGVTASYLLYDFGGRNAALELAQQTLVAVEATRDATLQAAYLSAVQAYFTLLAGRANIDALVTAEKLAQESLAAAQARYQSGAATPADKLQAQTALSQAKLNRITADGNVAIAMGTLANQLGFDAAQPIVLAEVANLQADAMADKKVADLIAEALRARPDLLAAEAQIKMAEAQIEVNRATGMPTLNLSAGSTYSVDSVLSNSRNDGVGVALTIPLFSGYRPTYLVRSAEAQKALHIADRDRIINQISLDVWKAYQTLKTNTESLQSAQDLVRSAEQSERMTVGRYKAGLGTMIDVLTAQNILVSARQQLISTRFNLIASRFTLAQTIGQLDIAHAEVIRETFSER